MTTENLLSELPSSHKPSPSTMQRLSNSKYGIQQVKRDTNRLHRCTIETQTVQLSFTILHRQYVTCGTPTEALLTGC